MEYAEKATNIEAKIDELNPIITSMKNASLESVWTGDASTSLNSELTDNIDKLETELQNVSSYAKALYYLDDYKRNCEEIEQLESRYNSTQPTQENERYLSSLRIDIRDRQSDNNSLKSEIRNILSNFGIVVSSNTPVAFDVSNINYSLDVDDLRKTYTENNSLTNIGNGNSIYNLYNSYDENGNVIEGSGKQYVENMIKQVQATYSGREAAINSALTILKLAADKNVKLDYEHKGTMAVEPYVPTSEVASGVDCNPFASWVVDKGTPGGFQWRPVTEFKNVGEAISVERWTTAQPGDVFVSNGHVGIIVQNDPTNNLFVTAEASNGIEMKTRTYSQLLNENYQVRDMTSVYSGSENTNREAFNEYVNWNTYERKI